MKTLARGAVLWHNAAVFPPRRRTRGRLTGE